MLAGAALRVAKLSAELGDLLRPPARGVVVLLYHRVGGRSGTQVDLPTTLFEAQMEVLAGERRVVTLEQALSACSGAAPPDGPDPVVVTFDDGTADFSDAALPILERFRIPVTVYLATAHIERRRLFPNEGIPLSWGALADALSTGLVTLGSHTHSHALLDRLPPDMVADELDRSIDLIRDRLDVAARHFAYPKAVPGSPEIEALVRARFGSAALGGNRPNPYGRTDRYRLARSAIQTSDGMRWFRRKLDGGMALEGSLRQALNRRRYAKAMT